MKRVVTHPRVFWRPWPSRQAWEFVDALIASPSLTVLAPGPRHAVVWTELVAETPDLAGNLVHDAAIVAVMREHGVAVIRTRDHAFGRFNGVEIRDPTL